MTIFTIDTTPCCKFVSIFDIGPHHESNKYTLPPCVMYISKRNDKYIIIIIMDMCVVIIISKTRLEKNEL